MKSFKTYSEAKQAGEKLAAEMAKGSQVAQLTASQAADALTALHTLSRFYQDTGKQITLAEVAAIFTANAKKLGDRSIPEAVEGFLTTVATVKRIDIKQAMLAFIAERELKTRAGKDGKRPKLSPEHHYNTSIWLNEFADSFPGHAVCDLTKDHIAAYMAGHSALAGKTRNERRGVVKMFVKWCAEKDYLPRQHRLLEGKVMENEDATPETIELYTAGELQSLLDRASQSPATAEPGEDQARDFRKLFPVLALAGLAGLRLREILRLDWQDIFHKSGYIEVGAEQAKTRSRRLVPLCNSLARWLEGYRGRTGKVWSRSYDMVHTDFAKLRAELGVKPRRNGLRHAYTSAHYALHSNEGLTAECAGHSPAMIHRHYKGLMTNAEAKQYFAVAPKNPANIIPLPIAAGGEA